MSGYRKQKRKKSIPRLSRSGRKDKAHERQAQAKPHMNKYKGKDE